MTKSSEMRNQLMVLLEKMDEQAGEIQALMEEYERRCSKVEGEYALMEGSEIEWLMVKAREQREVTEEIKIDMAKIGKYVDFLKLISEYLLDHKWL